MLFRSQKNKKKAAARVKRITELDIREHRENQFFRDLLDFFNGIALADQSLFIGQVTPPSDFACPNPPPVKVYPVQILTAESITEEN